MAQTCTVPTRGAYFSGDIGGKLRQPMEINSPGLGTCTDIEPHMVSLGSVGLSFFSDIRWAYTQAGVFYIWYFLWTGRNA